ncbi:MAG: hypothetical protein JWO88_900 [Frankiales bacterium]|jgi:hypothetical protein|nr:hypothetical protein [Frankiales bacterium]
MRDVTAIFGSTIFGGFVAASIASFMDISSGDASNPVLLAADSGFGLGLLLTALRRDDNRR